MSAYGPITRHANTNIPLQSTVWPTKNNRAGASHEPTPRFLTIHHLQLTEGLKHPDLIAHLHAVFAQEVEDGLTYPQEGPMDLEAFTSYFFGADVFVGVVGSNKLEGSPRDLRAGSTMDVDIDIARAGRTWQDCVAGYYYVKPNYPGRSSHICNAGFVVPPAHRGAGYGYILAESYVYYAPKLGYQASVFNLVYVNNTASIRLWEKLNFTKAGRIPRAGRLKRKDGRGEEYVDAWVFYRSFVEDPGDDAAAKGEDETRV